jgi:hypothetical protein
MSVLKNPEAFGMFPVHSKWTDVEVQHARFIRWAVLNQRISDARTSAEKHDEIDLKGRRVYPFAERPCPWTAASVRSFESRKL